MNTIILHGALAEMFGGPFNWHVKSPAEAIRALCTNKKGFEAALKKMAVRVIRTKPAAKTALVLDEKDIHIGMSSGIIHIVPAPMGAGGDDGVGKVIAGVVLIAAAFFTGGASLSYSGVVFNGLAGQAAFFLGTTLALSGLSLMLAPAPPSTRDEDKIKSFLFSGLQNSEAQGSALPLCYGHVRTGSVVGSVGINIEQIMVPAGGTYDSAANSFWSKFPSPRSLG